MLSDGALLAIALAGLGTTVFVVLFFAGFFRGSKVSRVSPVLGRRRGGLI